MKAGFDSVNSQQLTVNNQPLPRSDLNFAVWCKNYSEISQRFRRWPAANRLVKQLRQRRFGALDCCRILRLVTDNRAVLGHTHPINQLRINRRLILHNCVNLLGKFALQQLNFPWIRNWDGCRLRACQTFRNRTGRAFRRSVRLRCGQG